MSWRIGGANRRRGSDRLCDAWQQHVCWQLSEETCWNFLFWLDIRCVLPDAAESNDSCWLVGQRISSKLSIIDLIFVTDIVWEQFLFWCESCTSWPGVWLRHFPRLHSFPPAVITPLFGHSCLPKHCPTLKISRIWSFWHSFGAQGFKLFRTISVCLLCLDLCGYALCGIQLLFHAAQQKFEAVHFCLDWLDAIPVVHLTCRAFDWSYAAQNFSERQEAKSLSWCVGNRVAELALMSSNFCQAFFLDRSSRAEVS